MDAPPTSSPPTKRVIMLVGPTGSGKSATGNWLVSANVFQESESIDSATQQTVAHDGAFDSAFPAMVVDTPGYLDTGLNDAAHLAAMVDKVKSIEHVHLVALVLNFWNYRFDDNLKRLLRIFFSMFKHSNMWDNFAIIFTRCYREQATPQAKESRRVQFCSDVRQFVESLGARMACNPYCTFVDTHPEDNGPPDAAARSERASLAGFIASLSAMATQQMEDPGEYMSEEEETQMVVTEKNSTPVFERYPIVDKVPVMGSGSSFKIGIGGFSLDFGGGSKVVGWKTVTCGETSRLSGHTVAEKGVLMKRTKRVWYDGRTVSYSPWQVVDNFAREKQEPAS